MKKLIIAGLFFAGSLFAQLEPLGGCLPGDEFVPNGDVYCYWIPMGQQSNPTYVFACFQEGECRSACYPSECAEVMKAKPKPKVVLSSSALSASPVSQTMLAFFRKSQESNKSFPIWGGAAAIRTSVGLKPVDYGPAATNR